MWQLLSRNRKLNSFQIIIFGFAAVILVGTILLMLPISSVGRKSTPFLESLFTSTSAVCVTGLVLHDTGTYWSAFGQAVILALIQIGGVGVVTAAASFALVSGRKISLMQRSTIKEAISAPKVGGVVRLTGFIIKITLIIELVGAAVMAPVFCREFGFRGLWYALFHSVSAFCNAGFDLMGVRGKFSSLTTFAAQPVINITIMLLIIIGGIGFLTWDDIRTNKFHLSRYRMQTKVILCAAAILITIPAIYFFLFEFRELPLGKRLLCSFFQSVTPRTAGFNTVDLNSISEPGQYLIITLMLIGGAPGSTAGGIKLTTAAVLLANCISTFRRSEYAHYFGRRISDETIKSAATVLMMYVVLFWTGGLAISLIEGLPMTDCLFETASAIGTVGLSLSITQSLGTASRAILIALMFFGRVGGLTLIYAAVSGNEKVVSLLPQEKITVG